MKTSLSALLLSFCVVAVLAAQDEPPVQTPQQGGGGGGRGANAGAVPDPQPYDRIITKDAKTTKGLAPAPGGRGGRGGAQPSLDEKPMYRAELRALTTSVNAAITKAGDHETKAHLEGVRDEIARILDPKFLPPAPAAAAAGGGRGGLR